MLHHVAAGRERGAIALAERVMMLLDQGRTTTTYKYAVLLGLIDLCLENTARSGAPPTVITTRQMVEKVIELYWPQIVPYPDAGVLRQSGNKEKRATVLSDVRAFRDHAASVLGHAHPMLPRAMAAAPAAYCACVRQVEWTLIRYPLVLLQRIGGEDVRFLYEPGWDEDVSAGEVKRYQHGEPSTFDNRLMLLPGVGEHLVQLNNLLRPFIHGQWTRRVARMNDLEEARLQEFLFGAERVALAAVRGPLLDLQDGRCFYCDARIRSSAEVDHFLPWSRYPDNGLDNLVVADRICNGNKRDFLAASEHLATWAARRASAGKDLATIAAELAWERHPDRTLSVARAVYLGLPDEVRLWQRRDQFVPAHRADLVAALRAAQAESRTIEI